MPHTTTKNRRTKRFDTRPNSKLRAKANKQANDQLKIQDIRVTRKTKEEKNERLTNQQDQAFVTLSKDEKLLRALKKKLRGINELIEKQKRGDTLNTAQEEKVKQLDKVLEDMEGLLKKTNRKSRAVEGGNEDSGEDGDEVEGEEEEES